MIKLIKLNESKYVVVSKELDLNLSGTLATAMSALDWCGVDRPEIDFALSEFTRKGDEVAEFGVNGFMTFTSKIPRAA